MPKPHKHLCRYKTHDGPRRRTHYDEYCTEPYETYCIECHDEELAAQGATWEYFDTHSVSDAHPGL